MGNHSLIKRISIYFKSYKGYMILGYLTVAVATAISLVVPLFMGDVINQITEMRISKLLVIIGLIIASMCLESLSSYIFAVVGQKVTTDIRCEAWYKALNLKVSSYDKTHSGEISSRLVNDSSVITSFLSSDLPSFVIGIITIISALIIMFKLDFILTLIFLLLTPLILLTILPISNKILEISENQQMLLARLNGIFTETLSHIRLVKSYVSEDMEFNKGKKEIKNLYLCGKRNARIQAVLTPVMGTISTLMLIAVCGLGAYRVGNGFVSAGILVSFILYLFEIMQPIQSIGSFVMELQALKGSTQKLMELMDEDSEICCDGVQCSGDEDLHFVNVSFGYDPANLVLHNLNFTFKKGEVTSIVGESGSGKTTILSLIEKFYNPTSGEIKFGDIIISDYSIGSWRNMIGYVSQDNIITSGTIRDNIIYGLAVIPMQEAIDTAAQKANILDFINQLPNKYDTVVGERGVLLSGGQKQRLSIARAFLRNPKLLILDEVTANLDADSEEVIQSAVKALSSGRTTVIIAHRLSTILNSDQIIVLQNGEVSGIGKHAELYQTNPYYNSVFFKQNYVQESALERSNQ